MHAVLSAEATSGAMSSAPVVMSGVAAMVGRTACGNERERQGKRYKVSD